MKFAKKRMCKRTYIFLMMLFLLLAATPSAAPVELTVYTDQPIHPVSPMLYGLFFEDINFAADGGLHAEQVRNRSFEFEEGLFGWSRVEAQADRIEMKIQDENPLNHNNPHYLSLTIKEGKGQAGIKNTGYWGIPINKGKNYLFSVYARSPLTSLDKLEVRLEDKEGKVLGRSQVGPIQEDWKKYTARIQANVDEENAVLVLLVSGPGHIDLDMVSLFPEDTWKKQPNGLRADLVQILADMKPAFLRFPGGCVVEGKDLSNAYRWKDTIGDPAERKLNWNRWSGWNNPPEYYQSYGLGFFEYFRLCEDIGAEPVPILNCGMSCQFQDAQLVPLDELEPYVQDALDLIEYANGPADSDWGAKRAAAGHPKPFHLKYLGVGNEQWDEQYFERYNIFYKAIKAKYPEIQIVTTAGPYSGGQWFNLAWRKFKSGTPAEIVDEHYYMGPQWFLRNTDRYDSYDRSGPKVFAGEYAAHTSTRRNSLFAALTEAAFITGLERNSDIVIMSSYAPLFSRAEATQWLPDLIWFDKTRVYGTPSYYVQKLFSTHSGTGYLKSDLKRIETGQREIPAGRIGLGTWQTSAEFKDVKVTRGDQVLFTSMEASDWRPVSGNWNLTDGTAVQSDRRVSGALCLAGDPGWSDYTLSLKARKIRGDEGFLVVVRFDESENGVRWNIGGWGNTQHAVQVLEGGSDFIAASARGSIEQDRWYDVQIVLKGENVRCLLDGKEIHSVDIPKRSSNQVFASCTRDERKETTCIKVVNPTAEAVALKVNLEGKMQFRSDVSMTILTGDGPGAENTLDNPKNVYPIQSVLNGTGSGFSCELKPYSMVFFEMKQKQTP